MSPNNWQLPLPLTSFIDIKQDLRYRPRLNYVFISHGSSEWPQRCSCNLFLLVGNKALLVCSIFMLCSTNQQIKPYANYCLQQFLNRSRVEQIKLYISEAQVVSNVGESSRYTKTISYLISFLVSSDLLGFYKYSIRICHACYFWDNRNLVGYEESSRNTFAIKQQTALSPSRIKIA